MEVAHDFTVTRQLGKVREIEAQPGGHGQQEGDGETPMQEALSEVKTVGLGLAVDSAPT
jgi:hypothetical protein